MRRFAVAIFGLMLVSGVGLCQTTAVDAGGPCPAEPASLKPTEPDIFNDQQEQWLGDALAETMERSMRFAPAAENVYLQKMGERMLAVLPPTGLHFQFRIYESGEFNAFGIGGGRIYVSRKVIALLKSEDELAGLLAHEIGHNITHQEAVEYTAELRDWLGIKSVGDRADIFAKVHQLQEAEPKRAHWHPPSDEHDQDVADEVAIYAMMRAGYPPAAYAAAFDRVTANKGKMGNAFTDLLTGGSTEATRRYRAAVKMAQTIPPHCMGQRPAEAGEFAAWQKLLAERTTKEQETTDALKVMQLQDPVRADLRSIRYSPDGKYLLAQDYAAVFVLQRSPLKVLFTIDIEDSMRPHFTPDSSKVVVLTDDLRVEHWDVATQKRVLVKEMVLPEGCDGQELSPDGKVLMCQHIYFDKNDYPALSMALWNVDTNEVIFKKDNFVTTGPGFYSQAIYLVNCKYSVCSPASSAFSPDSHYFLAALYGEQVLVDLATGKKISMEHGVNRVQGSDFVFIGNDKVMRLGVPVTGGETISFPDGKTIKPVNMPAHTSIEDVTRGNFAIVRPIKDNADGLLDLNTGKLVSASKYFAMDAYGDEMASQNPRGGVQLSTVKDGNVVATIELPLSRLGRLLDAHITPDGKFLLASTASRSAIWSLDSGKRRAVLRPFSRSAILPGDLVYFDFVKENEKPRAQATIDLLKGTSADAVVKLPEKESTLAGDMYTLRKPDNPDKPNSKSTYEFYDLQTGKLLWSRRFAHAVPTIYRDQSADRIGMWWEMSDKGGREEIDSDPALKQAMEATGKDRDGMVLQMVDAKTGNVLQTIAVKEHKPKHARDVRGLFAFGDYLLVEGESDNTAIYRLSDKSRIGEVYGSAVAGDVSSGLLAMTNRRNEIFLLEPATAKELARYTLGSDVRLAQFIPEKKQLLVLTAEQKVYTFDRDGLPATVAHK